jgi:hypothetical protein
MRSALSAVLALLIASPAGATPWNDFGPRAMGMGGAQVAIAQGPLAAYWNPAGLGQLYDTTGFEAVGTGQAQFTGTILRGANDLNQVAQDCSSGGAGCTDANIQSALNDLSQPRNGILVNLGAGIDAKVGPVTVFANDFFYSGASPRVDLANNTTATVANNQSALVRRGRNIAEFGLAYGHEILETGLIVGAAAKILDGRIGYSADGIVGTRPGTFRHSFDTNDNIRSSVRPGLDLGLLWDMRETFSGLPWRPRLGVVGRNINSPKFNQSAAAVAAGEPSRYTLQAQARAGAALSPFPWWHLAADVDLTDNATPVDGLHSRNLSLGTEINVFNQSWLNIPLRAGIEKNVSKTGDSALAYTAGFGLHFAHIMLDVAGMLSAKRTDVQTQDSDQRVPSVLGVSGRFAFLFGGEDEGARNDRDRRDAEPPVRETKPLKTRQLQ